MSFASRYKWPLLFGSPAIALLALAPLYHLPRSFEHAVMTLSLVAAFVVPAIGALSVLFVRSVPLVLRLVLAPIYYGVVFVVAGAIAWGLCGLGGMCTN